MENKDMKRIPQATLVLANHRPETFQPHSFDVRHDAVILEEPPDPNFSSMLNGSLSIDAYLEEQEMEYPEFSRQMAKRLQEYHREGIRLYQVEPFIEHLLSIHERFAEGESPSDIPADSCCNRSTGRSGATAALIQFYDTSLDGSFEETLEAVQRFAHPTPGDSLCEIVCGQQPWSVSSFQPAAPISKPARFTTLSGGNCVGACRIGYPLKVNFLMADAVRELGYSRHLYGPGDLLTLLYRFHPKGRFRCESLLAARR
jgi:hypothetical protein